MFMKMKDLAKKHVNPTIFSRLEKSKAKDVESRSCRRNTCVEANQKAPAEETRRSRSKAEEKPAEEKKRGEI